MSEITSLFENRRAYVRGGGGGFNVGFYSILKIRKSVSIVFFCLPSAQ